jgi:O-antigen ligase
VTRIGFHNKCHYILALLIAFTLPFVKFTPIFIGLIFVNWLAEGGLLVKLKRVFSNKCSLLFVLFYTAHIIGLLYTENLDSGFFDLEVKLSLLIFPLVISGKPFSKKEVSHVFVALIVGLVYASFYMLSRSLSLYLINGENAFFYGNLASYIHTSYVSMYMNVAIVGLFLSLLKKEDKLFSNISSILIITFFVIMIMLFSSKTGVMVLIVSFLSLLGYFVFYQKRYLLGTLGFALMVLGLFLISQFSPKIMMRVNNFVEAVTSDNENDDAGSTANRIMIWGSSNQIIKDNFFIGVGTGDVKDELNLKYEKEGIENALKRNFNAHNEYYQVFLALGVLGFILLSLGLIYPLIKSYNSRDYLYIGFLIIIGLNFFTESMLETQAGVLFYAFFNSIFCFRKTT